MNRMSLEDSLIDQWISEAEVELNLVKKEEIVNKILDRIQNELYTSIYNSHSVNYMVLATDWEGLTIPYLSPLFYYMHEKISSDLDPTINIGSFPLVEFNFVILVTLSLIITQSLAVSDNALPLPSSFTYDGGLMI